MAQSPSKRLEELIRKRVRLDVELEQCKELVSVLFVDIVGSTRFYDQHGDVAGLVMVQKCLDLLIPLIEQHGGTVIKTIGDAILARFGEAETAVRCAIEMQRHVAERNRGRAPDDQIHVRVAINFGLAFLNRDDVFGDMVNVTARIETVTEANEISISPSVYEKIQHLPDIRVRKKGAGVELKGKRGKLDLYAVAWFPDEAAGSAPPPPSKRQLALSSGLHTGLVELAQRLAAGSIPAKPSELPQRGANPTKTAVLGAAEVEELPPVGMRFLLARVRADGSLIQGYPLDHPGMIAGREGEISLHDDPLVAPQHARFTQLGDAVYVEDLGSAHGVFLRLREAHRLRDGDVIQMGQQRLRFTSLASDAPLLSGATRNRGSPSIPNSPAVMPPASIVGLNSSDEEITRYKLHDPETSVGRSKGTYTFPDDLCLSATHARITFQRGQYFLEDLGSTNGTFVRVRKRVLIRDGDTLMIGRQLVRALAEPFSSPSV